MKELGRKVKAQRAKMGLSQTDLGRRVGRTHGWVSNLEHGLIAEPPAEVLTAVATQLGHDPAEYLRLAGRVSLTADDLVPSRVADLPPETAAAVERAVANALTPLVERIDRLLTLLEQRPGAPSGDGARS